MRNPSLTKQQQAVLFDKVTEAPFSGKWLTNTADGEYACANCGSVLFDSSAKFESDCGWPSFDRAIKGTVAYNEDTSHRMRRVEVVCARCGGHLGHVFPDGPMETTGDRYCINSLALEFTKR